MARALDVVYCPQRVRVFLSEYKTEEDDGKLEALFLSKRSAQPQNVWGNDGKENHFCSSVHSSSHFPGNLWLSLFLVIYAYIVSLRNNQILALNTRKF